MHSGKSHTSIVWVHQGEHRRTAFMAHTHRSVPKLASEPPTEPFPLTEASWIMDASVCKPPLPAPLQQMTDGYPSKVSLATIGWNRNKGVRAKGERERVQSPSARPKHFFIQHVLSPLWRIEEKIKGKNETFPRPTLRFRSGRTRSHNPVSWTWTRLTNYRTVIRPNTSNPSHIHLLLSRQRSRGVYSSNNDFRNAVKVITQRSTLK